MGTVRWKELGEAYFDDLTGILNKKFFLSLGKFVRGHSIVIVIFDIDNFKYINDRYGHQAGDHVISEVGRMLDRTVPSECYPVRFGGDEFIAVFEDYRESDVYYITEKFRASIYSRIFEYGGKTISVTCSFGIASSGSREECLKRADDALYASKTAGKNCTTLYREGFQRKRKYIPMKIERDIRGDLTSGRSILISGGFGSGKSLLLEILKSGFPEYRFLDLDEDEPPEDTKMTAAAYNPVMIHDDERKKRYIFRLGRASYTSKYRMRNFSKNELVGMFSLYGRDCSLFRINYLDLVSSGNPMTAAELLSEEKLIGAKVDKGDEIKCLMSLLPEEAVQSLKETARLGVRFTQRDISVKGVNGQAVRCLEELMILERRGMHFVYQYPEIFFKNSQMQGGVVKSEYRHILETAEILSDARKRGDWKMMTEAAERLYCYGDLQCASEILDEARAWDDRALETAFKVYTAKGDFESAERMAGKIEDAQKSAQCRALLDTVSGARKELFDDDDKYFVLLNMSVSCAKRDFDEFERQRSKIDLESLSPKEMLSYLLSDAFASRERGRIGKSLSSYRQAERISLRNHYLADYGKIQMHLGMLHESEGDFEKSLRHFRNALNIFFLANQQNSIFSAKLNLANVYCTLGDLNSAEKIYLELLSGIKDGANSRRAAICNNLSDMYLRWWKTDEALDYAERAFEISLKSKLGMQKDVEILISKIKTAAGIRHSLNIIDYFNDNDIILCLDIKAVELACRKRLSSADIKSGAAEIITMFEGTEEIYKTELLIFLALCFKKKPRTSIMLLSMALDRLKSSDMPMRMQFVREKMEEL